MQSSLKTQIADRTTTKDVETKKGNVFGPQGLGGKTVSQTKDDKVRTAVETMKGKLTTELTGAKTTIKTGIDNAARMSAESTGQVKTTVATEGQAGRTTTLTGAAIGASATRGIGASIVGGLASVRAAIYASRPIINVSPTTINNTTRVLGRYGPYAGSRYTNGGNIREGAD
jgi:hypothetical protein